MFAAHGKVAGEIGGDRCLARAALRVQNYDALHQSLKGHFCTLSRASMYAQAVRTANLRRSVRRLLKGSAQNSAGGADDRTLVGLVAAADHIALAIDLSSWMTGPWKNSRWAATPMLRETDRICSALALISAGNSCDNRNSRMRTARVRSRRIRKLVTRIATAPCVSQGHQSGSDAAVASSQRSYPAGDNGGLRFRSSARHSWSADRSLDVAAEPAGASARSSVPR